MSFLASKPNEMAGDGEDSHAFLKQQLRGTEVDGYRIGEALSSGAFGLTFEATHIDTNTKCCIKIALSSNASLLHEAAIMRRLVDGQPAQRTRHLCRLYSSGVVPTAGRECAYLVMEFCPGNPVQMIDKFNGFDQMIVICNLSLQLLNGIYSLHAVGIIHRDIKPENIGLRRSDCAVLLDFGGARVITEPNGCLRQPRSQVPLEGTYEWCSLSAERGTDQGRCDDLFGWLYTMVEIIFNNEKMPLPWANFERNPKLRQLIKSARFPAKLLLRDLSIEFYEIHAYLHSLTQSDAPNYTYIAGLLYRAQYRYLHLKRVALGEMMRNEPMPLSDGAKDKVEKSKRAAGGKEGKNKTDNAKPNPPADKPTSQPCLVRLKPDLATAPTRSTGTLGPIPRSKWLDDIVNEVDIVFLLMDWVQQFQAKNYDFEAKARIATAEEMEREALQLDRDFMAAFARS